MNISIVIPQYKGKEKLYANLKKNMPFFAGCEVIVVNDYPDVPLTKEMHALFPTVKVIENPHNLGFAGAVAAGIKQTSAPYVFLLNNDVILGDNTFTHVLKEFDKDTNLFAVSFKQVEKDGGHVGRNTIFWHKGFFQHRKGDPGTHGINGWAEGGSMVFDKKKYESIHGFDTLFSPFYWEDIDLSYRAWKAGYTIRFDTSVVVEHHHESTIATYFQQSRIKTIAYRNQFITIWKNISDPLYLLEHCFFVIKNSIIYPMKGHSEFVSGLWMAIQLLPHIMKKRVRQQKIWKRTDREIFSKFI